MEKIIIGITGGIASGKSTVCKFLAENGFEIIDADKIGHEVLTWPDVIKKIETVFGRETLNNQNSEPVVDRKKLGAIVFNDPEKMKVLESITHPAIVSRIYKNIEETDKPIVLEAIGLFKSGLYQICDSCWLVEAPQKIQIDRLMKSRGFTREEAEIRVLSQEREHDWDRTKMNGIIDSSKPMEIMENEVNSLLQTVYNNKEH